MNKDNLIYNYINYSSELILVLLLLFIISHFLNLQHLQNIVILLFLFVIFFFRNNKVNIIENNNKLISASSGVVENIEVINDYYKITIYLSPFDPHYIISPCSSKIIHIYNLNTENDERKRIEFDNNILLDLAVINNQLTNLFIKERVMINVKNNDYIKQGEKIGLIRFGSQIVYYILIKNHNLKIKINDNLIIGESIIAEKKI